LAQNHAIQGLDPPPNGAAEISSQRLKTIEALIEALQPPSISLEVPEDVDRFLSISRCQVTQTGPGSRRYKEMARASPRTSFSIKHLHHLSTTDLHSPFSNLYSTILTFKQF
jgi:hypothetical protein